MGFLIVFVDLLHMGQGFCQLLVFGKPVLVKRHVNGTDTFCTDEHTADGSIDRQNILPAVTGCDKDRCIQIDKVQMVFIDQKDGKFGNIVIHFLIACQIQMQILADTQQKTDHKAASFKQRCK